MDDDNDYNECGTSIHICTTLTDAAKEIMTRSYAIYQVPTTTSCKIRQAHQQAVQFFDSINTTNTNPYNTMQSPSSSSSSSCCCSQNNRHKYEYQNIVDGHLFGYNEPSTAKQLFRAFVHSPHQPWPTLAESSSVSESKDDITHNLFRQSSIDLVDDFHKILVGCYQNIISISSVRQQQKKKKPQNRTKKRKRCFFDDQQPQNLQQDFHDGTNDGNRSSNDDDLDGSSQTTAAPLPPPCSSQFDDNINENTTIIQKLVSQRHLCPLDYFLYHNRRALKNDDVGGKNSSSVLIPNCTEHIDRGRLIVVCLTNVPGLEVLDLERLRNLCHHDDDRDSCFVCPETIVHNYNLYHDVEEMKTNLVCIMAGDQLHRDLVSLLGLKEEEEIEVTAASAVQVPPCVHRVRNNLKRARLSISYELR
mmetsp:Transcript_2516/g.5478  ORF Transcript_2516/g.5478 Transcript_2516/m.5478 type:complete len:418 (+) Transcript_2516:79-1332(+)